jgi:hypothetical protein
MKLNVFGSVAEAEGHADGSEPLYRYEFRPGTDASTFGRMPAREFVAQLFEDVLASVTDDSNYTGRYSFDKHVFQKFIALMFVNYATTDPIFYGTNRADYGVSDEKDMEATPLYAAVSKELREIEAELALEASGGVALVDESAKPVWEPPTDGQPVLELPGTLINEDVLLGPIANICAAAQQLCKNDDHETASFAKLILADASRLVKELKRLNIVSPFAYDPGADGRAEDCGAD